MLIIGQVGSGPKEDRQTSVGPLWEEKGREESASREVGHAGDYAGRPGQVGRFRVALQSQVKRLWHNGNRKEPPLLFTAQWCP